MWRFLGSSARHAQISLGDPEILSVHGVGEAMWWEIIPAFRRPNRFSSRITWWAQSLSSSCRKISSFWKDATLPLCITRKPAAHTLTVAVGLQSSYIRWGVPLKDLFCINFAVDAFCVQHIESKLAYDVLLRSSLTACPAVVLSFLPVQALCFPIDTSLSFVQANKLIRDLKPTNLVLPLQYTLPPLLQPHRTDLVIETVRFGLSKRHHMQEFSWLAHAVYESTMPDISSMVSRDWLALPVCAYPVTKLSWIGLIWFPRCADQFWALTSYW